MAKLNLDEDDPDVLRLDYDDDLLAVVQKIERILKRHGLEFVDDGQEHCGFTLSKLTRIPVEPEGAKGGA